MHRSCLYLLPPTNVRLEAVGDVMAGVPRSERYLFYGLDALVRAGMHVRDNIRHHQAPTFLTWRMLELYRIIIRGLGTYGGALEWILPHWRACASAKSQFVYSDRLMFPIVNLRLAGMLPRIPTVYIAMGLPEKFAQFRKKSRLPAYLAEFNRLGRIISFSKTQANILQGTYGLQNVEFLRDGVDTSYFRPIDMAREVDVLSIGADPFRDFQTLLDAATQLPSLTFRLVTSRAMALDLGDVPSNVKILTDIPMEEIRGQMAKSLMLALPVRENSYSGATTVLLQAMSMGKAVIGNPIGANREGYPFHDGMNCLMIPPGDPAALVRTIRSMSDNAPRRMAIGEEARRTIIRELDINRFHNQLFEIIQNVFLSFSSNQSTARPLLIPR